LVFFVKQLHCQLKRTDEQYSIYVYEPLVNLFVGKDERFQNAHLMA